MLRKCVRYLPYVLLVLVLSSVIFIRLRLLQVPLERDEGEYAYVGQLLLKGITPYLHAYTMKLPGVGAAYALIMLLFGQTPAGIHFGLLIVNAINIFLVHLLTERLFDREAAVFSAASYAVMSLSLSVLGVFAHATHFVTLFVLGGFIMLLRYEGRDRLRVLFFSGVLLGFAILMKQQSLPLVVFAYFLLFFRHGHFRPFPSKKNLMASLAFLLGVILPYSLVALGLALSGVFDEFWFWTVRYALAYSTELTVRDGVIRFWDNFTSVVNPQLPLWILAAVGAVCLPFRKGPTLDKVFVYGFFVSSFLAVCPGFYFREHYFVLMLPATALLIAVAMAAIRQLTGSLKQRLFFLMIPTILFASALIYGFHQELANLFLISPLELSRAVYFSNPFPEFLRIARYIKDHTTDKDRIAVLGSEPQMYFYASRLSATGHIYMYGLVEDQPYASQMQRELIEEIMTSQPKYIVEVMVSSSWLCTESLVRQLTDRIAGYINSQYDLVGVVDILDTDSRYIWGPQAMDYKPRSESFINVYERKSFGSSTNRMGFSIMPTHSQSQKL